MKLLHYQFQVCNFVIIWKVSVLLLIVMDYLYFDMNIKHLHPTVLQCYGWEIQHKIEINIGVETPSNISLFRKLSISCDLMRFGPIYNWDVILSFHYWPGRDSTLSLPSLNLQRLTSRWSWCLRWGASAASASSLPSPYMRSMRPCLSPLTSLGSVLSDGLSLLLRQVEGPTRVEGLQQEPDVFSSVDFQTLK